MIHLLISFLLVVSPIWPIGENPLVGDPYLIVNKSTNELAYILDGEIKQVYDVATGALDHMTPEGEHNMIVKAINPHYRKLNIPGGDKKNPLGTRWIGFDAEETDGRIYGIHGTNNPQSIGKYVSLGCIRMKNEDVEILYDEILLGTKILITSSEESFEELGRQGGAIALEAE